jgi:hypothetical protein
MAGAMTSAQLSPTGARSGAPAAPRVAAVHDRLYLALAGLWTLDGLLQFQPYMFTKNFAEQTLAAASQGSPGWVADPVTWAADIIRNNPVSTNTAFALIQLALGLGLAYRPTRRAALACSIGWAASVWFLGESFGGLLAGQANPLTGAPGSSGVYMLIGILLWPGRRPGSFAAARFVGARAAKAVWSVLWAGLAVLTLQPDVRAAGSYTDAVTGMMGEPAWYAGLVDPVARFTEGRETEISAVLAVLLALIAASVWLKPAYVRAGLIAASVLTLVYWVVGQAFGMPFMGMATDPNTGPVLVLLAALYWPARTDAVRGATLTGPEPAAAPGDSDKSRAVAAPRTADAAAEGVASTSAGVDAPGAVDVPSADASSPSAAGTSTAAHTPTRAGIPAAACTPATAVTPATPATLAAVADATSALAAAGASATAGAPTAAGASVTAGVSVTTSAPTAADAMTTAAATPTAGSMTTADALTSADILVAAPPPSTVAAPSAELRLTPPQDADGARSDVNAPGTAAADAPGSRYRVFGPAVSMGVFS